MIIIYINYYNPLENSIIHGFEDCKRWETTCNSEFNGRRLPGFHIEDNGKGISKDSCVVRSKISSNYDVIDESIGISNVYNRMRMYMMIGESRDI